MKKFTKIISVLMAAVMVVSALCVSAYADSAPPSPESAYKKAKLVDSGKTMSFTMKADKDDSKYGVSQIYKVELSKAGTLKLDVTAAVSSFHIQVLDKDVSQWMPFSEYSIKTGSFLDTYDNGPWINWDESFEKAKLTMHYNLEKGVYYVRIFSIPEAKINGKTTVKFTYPQAKKSDDSAKITSFSATLKKGSTLQLGTILSGEGDVTWSSSKKSVATVSKNGKITAKAKGTAVITAKTGDSSMKITIKVTA